MDHFNSWKDLLNPQFYIDLGGLWVVLFIVFAETGLFVGFFLPGDSLLFVSGIFAPQMLKAALFSTGSSFLDTTIIAVLVSIAAILGNMVAYWFGKKSGPALYDRPDNFFFRKKYLFKAHDFYEENGRMAVIAARFLPIVRTFAPIVAGIVGMDKAKFMFYNIVGAVLWSFTMIFAGHYLDKLFLSQFNFDLKKHLEIIVLVIVLVTTAPVLFKLFFGKDKRKSA